jgi:hypothetical protein
MKILDRYVLISFLLNYVIAFMVLVGLYVVLDMAFSLDEWAEFKDVSPTQVQQPTTQPGAAPSAPADSVEGQSALQLIGRMADFYFHHLFVVFVQLAFLAAGVPLLRLALPIILAGVVLTFALPIAAQELVIPNMIPQLMRKHDQAARDEVLVYPIMAMQDNNNALVYGARYFAPMDNRPAGAIRRGRPRPAR